MGHETSMLFIPNIRDASPELLIRGSPAEEELSMSQSDRVVRQLSGQNTRTVCVRWSISIGVSLYLHIMGVERSTVV